MNTTKPLDNVICAYSIMGNIPTNEDIVLHQSKYKKYYQRSPKKLKRKIRNTINLMRRHYVRYSFIYYPL